MKVKGLYRKLKRSIVAFTYPYPNEEYPEIIGTGFVARGDGIVVTNRHVTEIIDNIRKSHRFPKKRFPVQATIFVFVPGYEGMLEIPLEIHRVYFPFEEEEDSPDLAFVQVKAKRLQKVTIDSSTFIEEGIEVGTTGFPMGTIGMNATGKYQATPTLQKGIISAVQSFPCKKPYSFSVDIMTQGGSSGSPVFSWKNGRILGVLFAGLNDVGKIGKRGIYEKPTNISYVIPSHYINEGLKALKPSQVKLPSDTLSLKEMLDEMDLSVLDELEE